MPPNQNPEQIARDAIDAQLRSAGWAIQYKDAINFHEDHGQAVREYVTDTGPADYVLFVDGKPVGVIEAKKEEGESINRPRGQNWTPSGQSQTAGPTLLSIKSH